jgi:hypothetical protein
VQAAAELRVADETGRKVVHGVHAVRPREICATQFISATLAAAEKYAQVMSTDPDILAAAVTSYVMEAEGRRSPEALYVAGKRQQMPYVSDGRRITANGHGAARYLK